MPDDEASAPSATSSDRSTNATTRVGRRRPRGYGLVLLTIVLAIVIASLGQSRLLTQSVSLILISTSLLLALRTAQVPSWTMRRATVLVAIALAIGLLSGSSVVSSVPESLVLIIGAILIASTSLVLAQRLVRNPEVTLQTIVGALCVYLLIGLFFAFVFAATQVLTQTPFFTSLAVAGTPDYLYFSFITLSTVGYGDLVASTNLGRMLAATEGLTGQLYLVTVVALLVSNLNRPGPRN
jgi:hypothetical protein